jgi:hypothetical protein
MSRGPPNVERLDIGRGFLFSIVRFLSGAMASEGKDVE